MAMVIFAAFLPSHNELFCLRRLYAPIRVFQPSCLTVGTNELLLASANDYSIRLSVDYNDVIFKFECFSLKTESTLLSSWPSASVIAILDGWHIITCLFRFEWEREALNGEVPINLKQIVRQRGIRNNISNAATAVGVSMVGLEFWDVEKGMPIASIISNDDDPATFRIYRESCEIKALNNECECVKLDEVAQWSENLKDWLKLLGTN
jgi:hypothetical protein